MSADSPDVLIVGAGPAGSALALHLARIAPDVARRTLVLEKSRHPRHKVCAGGLIPHTLQETTFGDLVPEQPVNLETDVLAKYVEKLLPASLRR